MKENPFDEFDIRPGSSLEEITQSFRERAENATEDERRRLRAAWEALTLHPRRRLVSALLTFPERAGERLGSRLPAPAPRVDSTPPMVTSTPFPAPSVAHLVPRPSSPPSSLPRPLDDDYFVDDPSRTPKGPPR